MSQSAGLPALSQTTMDTSILGARNLRARQRIFAAAEALAAKFDLAAQADALQRIQGHDPLIKALRQSEAIADLLEALVQATGAVTAERATENDPHASDADNGDLVLDQPGGNLEGQTNTIGEPSSELSPTADLVEVEQLEHGKRGKTNTKPTSHSATKSKHAK